MRRTDDKILPVFDDTQIIGLNSIHTIQPRTKELSCKWLMAILNSQLLTWYFQYENFHMVGKPLAEVKVVFVERLPIANVTIEQQQPFIAKADIMLSKNKELQQCKQNFLKLLQAKYETLTINKKLTDWPTLSFKDFLKELEKQKVKLSLPE